MASNKRTGGRALRSRRSDCLVATASLLAVGGSRYGASAFQAPCGISAQTKNTHCPDAPCSSTSPTSAAGRVPRYNSKQRIRPRAQYMHLSSPPRTRLWAANQPDGPSDDPNSNEGGISNDGEFGGDDESTSYSSSDEDTANDLGDCVSKGCSIDYIDAIAKLAAEQEMEVIAAASSSDVLVGDIFPVLEADGTNATQSDGKDDSSSKPTPKTITAEMQSRSIETIRDDAIERSKAKKKDRSALSKSIPSYRSLMTFVTTTVLIWLSEPLLSLIDTTAVGRFAGVTTSSATATTLPNFVKTKLFGFLAYFGIFNEARPDLPALSPSVLNLASLGPATLLIDNCLYICYFLSIATTNKLAKNLAQKDTEGMVRTTSHVLGVAVVMGLLMTGFVWGFGESVLSGIVGESATAGVGTAATVSCSAAVKTSVVNAALDYARIRSSIGILAVLDIVSQSVLLATLDLKTPVLAVIVTSLTNIFGDWLLVVKLGMGIRGAAIATAAANVVSCSILLSAVFRKFSKWKKEAAKEKEETMWREGRVSIAGLNGGESSNATQADVEPILPDGLGVVGSKAKRKPSNTDDDTSKEKTTSNGVEIPKHLQLPSIGRSSKEQFVIALDNIQKGLVRTTAMASELAAAFSLSVKAKALGKQARIQLSTNGRLAKSAKAAMQKIFGRKDDLPPFISLPRKDDFVSLLKFAGPIFFIILLKVMCYSQMTLRASDMGMLSLASHNVLLRIFFFYTTFGDAFSQAAQTFLPEVMYGLADKAKKGEDAEISSGIAKDERREKRRERVKATLGRMLALSGIVAVLNSGISTWILSNCGGWFTSDTNIISMIGSKNSRFLSFSVLLHSFVMLFEGGIMASGPSGLMYLLKSYMATFVLLTGALKYGASDLGGVWKVWFGFQVVRLFQFGARVWKKTVIGSADTAGNGAQVPPEA